MYYHRSYGVLGLELLVVDSSLEAVAIVASNLSHPLKGGGLRMIYLAERVYYQLVGEDAPWVPMDLSVIMLAPRSMTNAKYNLWGLGTPFTN